MDWHQIPGFDTRKEQYVRLDQEKWLKDHGVRQQGERQGRANQPATDSDGLDEIETSIVDWVNQRARQCREDVSGHLTGLETDLANDDLHRASDLLPLAREVVRAAGEAELDIDRLTNVHRANLRRHENAVRETAASYAEFRQEAGLGRPADYSKRGSALIFILVCWLIECLLNAGLLMEVNPFGLVGSFMQMGLISAANVLLMALATGGLLRQTNHVKTSNRALAWGGIVLLITFVIGFNLLVGHYRDSMQAVVNDPTADLLGIGQDTMARMLDSPFGLQSFQSYLLALLGFLFYCVASWKWLQRDDSYPTYGQRSRQYEQACDRYRQPYEDALVALQTTYHRHKSDLDDVAHRVTISRNTWLERCARARKIVEDFQVNMGQHNRDLDYLLEAYRTANRNARSMPSPAHFGVRERVDEAVFEPPSFQPPNEADLTEVFANVDKAVATLQHKWEDAMREFPNLDELLDGRSARAQGEQLSGRSGDDSTVVATGS